MNPTAAAHASPAPRVRLGQVAELETLPLRGGARQSSRGLRETLSKQSAGASGHASEEEARGLGTMALERARPPCCTLSFCPRPLRREAVPPPRQALSKRQTGDQGRSSSWFYLS